MGTIRLPLRCSSSAMLYAVRRGSRSPITAHVSHSSSIRSTHSCRCQSLTSSTLGWPHECPLREQYPLFALSEEHQAIREAVRDLCEAKVAPYAAAVDEEARYPHEAAAALQAADFHAPHVPEEYGGAGADALATVLVIEEIARVCMASSLIPAVNKLGSMPVILSGSAELQKKYLTKLAAGEGGFSYCLSEPDAGSDAVAMKTRAVRDGDDWVLDGVKRWITNAGVSEYYTVMAVTDPESRARRASRRSWSRSPTRASRSGRRRRSSASRAARPARSTSTRSGSPPTG